MCDQQRLRPAGADAQSDQSLCLSLEYSMTVKVLTGQHLEFLSLKGGCPGSSALVKMPHCWKSHVAACIWNESSYTLFIAVYLPIHIDRISKDLSILRGHRPKFLNFNTFLFLKICFIMASIL